MNKNRKGILLLLVVFLMLGMTACTNKTGGDGETITLRILENDTAKQKGYLDELLTAF